MSEFDEKKLVDVAKPYFSSARAGDWEHALRVVRWVKELGKERGDLHLIITAAYIHDIGWSGVAPKGKIDFEEMLKLEPKANKNSSKLIHEVLVKMHCDDTEIQTVQRLVAAADKYKAEKDDEEVIVEADALSKLCREHLEEKYLPSSFYQLVQTWEAELPHHIKTPRGKELFTELLSELKSQLEYNSK